MSDSSERAALERLRQVILARLGLRFDEDKRPLLAAVAAERRLALRLDLPSYVSRVARPDERDELRVLAERLTVGETYFFRSSNDLQAFLGLVLPERMRLRAPERKLRILSAGCSSGEEPYTIAMLLRGVPQLSSWDLSIRAVDVNPAAIARAVQGRYTAWSLRQTPPEITARFFVEGRGAFRVVDEVRERVIFEERNVTEDDPALWTATAYDVVFCRNVVMYFAPEVAAQVVGRIAGALAPGGFLFLGHAETLRGVSNAFHLRHSHGSFYYQLKEGGEAGAPAEATASLETQDMSWFEAIRQASERIAAMSAPAPAPPPGAAPEDRAARPAAAADRPPGAASDASWFRSARALDLLRHERHSEALAALGGESAGEDADAMLLRAVLLTSSGDLAASEAVCARILESDELNAEAHYVMALCREHAGDRAAATRHDHYAAYLDPGFAMPRLHLGLLAKRAGELEAVRRELSRALVLLAGEEGSRILLLGGGFSRDALLDLCRAELRACGVIW